MKRDFTVKELIEMAKKFKRIFMAIGGILLVLCAVQGYLLRGTPGARLTNSQLNSSYRHSTIPTILIPGWAGNTVTYNKLIKTYQKQRIAQKVLTVWVAPNGRIWTAGNYRHQRNALIQVLFTWNYNSTYHPQVKQLSQVLKYLYQHYHLWRVNVVAHSYGGTEFIHAYLGSKYLQHHLRLAKLVFLGVPVEESLSDQLKYQYHLINRSTDRNFQQLLRQMKEWQLNYPIKLYSIMGSEDGSKFTDGEVPHIQTEMLKALVKHQPLIKYQEITYSHTSHTQLHDRTVILQKIAQILWGK